MKIPPHIKQWNQSTATHRLQIGERDARVQLRYTYYTSCCPRTSQARTRSGTASCIRLLPKQTKLTERTEIRTSRSVEHNTRATHTQHTTTTAERQAPKLYNAVPTRYFSADSFAHACHAEPQLLSPTIGGTSIWPARLAYRQNRVLQPRDTTRPRVH